MWSPGVGMTLLVWPNFPKIYVRCLCPAPQSATDRCIQQAHRHKGSEARSLVAGPAAAADIPLTSHQRLPRPKGRQNMVLCGISGVVPSPEFNSSYLDTV